MEKIPLVLYSGGLDSTYVLQFALYSSPVDVLYANSGLHPLKVEQETLSRERNIELFNRVMPYKVHREFSPANPISFVNSPAIGFYQVTPWLISALQTVDPARHSEVQIGYVKGDSVAMVIHEVRAAWSALWRITKVGPEVPLTFPMLEQDKACLLEWIDPRAYVNVWVCENPLQNPKGATVACEACLPCQTHYFARRRFKIAHSESYDKWHKRRLKDLKQVTQSTPQVNTPYNSHNLIKDHVHAYRG